jgi:hypothetical protein
MTNRQPIYIHRKCLLLQWPSRPVWDWQAKITLSVKIVPCFLRRNTALTGVAKYYRSCSQLTVLKIQQPTNSTMSVP